MNLLVLLIKCFPGFFFQQSSWYTTGWLPQMLYNCGMLWLRSNAKINRSAIYSKRHFLALACFVLKHGQKKDAFPGLQCPLSQSLHLPLSWVPSCKNGKSFLYALLFSFIFLPFWSYAKKLLLNFCLPTTLQLAQTFLSFLFLTFILLFHMWAVYVLRKWWIMLFTQRKQVFLKS